MTRRTAAVVAATVLALVAGGAAPTYADGAGAADGIRDSQWHLRFLDVAEAHRISQGVGVTVAVVDSGVDATHPDLADNVLPGVGADNRTDGPARSDVDGRGTGLAGLVAGYGHGAGRAGAGTVGADGALGVAPRARILPVAFTTRPGQFGDPDVLADGIDVAVSRGATVICVGRGVPASPRLEQAVAKALRADVVVVAPLANRRNDGFLPWPAALVAGAAALVRARYPGLRADEVVRRLTATAKARTPQTAYGSGVLDLVGALTAPVPPAAGPTPSRSRGTAAAVPPVAPTPSATVAPAAAVKPAFDSGDWRRWLVALPLVGFLAALLAYAARGSRQRAAR